MTVFMFKFYALDNYILITLCNNEKIKTLRNTNFSYLPQVIIWFSTMTVLFRVLVHSKHFFFFCENDGFNVFSKKSSLKHYVSKIISTIKTIQPEIAYFYLVYALNGKITKKQHFK